MMSSSAPERLAPRWPGLRTAGLRLLLPVGALGWALTPLSSTWAGLAWLALCLGAALLSVTQAGRQPPRPQSPAARGARRWVGATALAALLAGAAMLGWHDPLSSLQDNVRLLLTAGAVWWLSRQGPLGQHHPAWLVHATASACVVAFGVALTHGRNELPSNAIPWAATVGFMLCLLAPAVLDTSQPRGWRRLWAAALLLGLLAVFLSRTRSAMLVAVWLAGLCMWQAWRQRHRAAAWIAGALLVALALVASTASWQADPLRLRAAGEDVVLALTHNNPDTPVGARLRLWQAAWQGITEAPLLGHGIAQRETAIKALAAQNDPRIWKSLGHFHNDYLNAWFDHGLPGLAAVLLGVAGIVGAALALQQAHPVASQQLWGVALLHASGGLTNVNMAHNLYALGLGLSVAVALLGAAAPPAPPIPSSGSGPHTP